MKLPLITLLLAATCGLSAQEFIPSQHATITTDRADGRHASSYAIVHNLLRQTKPRYAYHPGMSNEAFAEWQTGLRQAMSEVMRIPLPTGDSSAAGTSSMFVDTFRDRQPAPCRISTEQREGYTLEKWEFYPLPGAVSSFLVLTPDNRSKDQTPAVLCIPGSGRTKEGLAGEPGVYPNLTERVSPRTSMALEMVKAGYIAVAVDNAAAGEASDLEGLTDMGSDYDYDVTARLLLELGWSWLGYTSYLDMQVLQWMKTQPTIDASRIVVSGFSLGTEPMMVLGVLDPDIHAFIYNDFLCQTQERALVMTLPDEHGRREFPNSIRHLIPDFWLNFNFPDIVASLAPRPIIFTEGGLDRDFDLVRDAYRTAGAADKATCYHYPKFQDPSTRHSIDSLPEGLDRPQFFELVNVDPPMHYFKHELIMPWLQEVMK